MANIIVEFIVLTLACTSIGTWWFGWIGTIIWFVVGLFLFFKLRKLHANRVDYGRIGKMLDERIGPPK